MIEYMKSTSNENKWTSFFDMSSGGGEKLPYKIIYIEAPRREAIKIFEDRFDRDPENVTCDCCGQDFSIIEQRTLDDATNYYRSERSIEEYVQDPKILVIYREVKDGN